MSFRWHVVALVTLVGLGGCSSAGEVSDPSGSAITEQRRVRAELKRERVKERRAEARREARREFRREARRAAREEARIAAAEADTAEMAEAPAEPECDPNYSGACLDPNSPDYDCAGGSGDGPDYTGYVQVVGTDIHDLDRDGDGIGCD